MKTLTTRRECSLNFTVSSFVGVYYKLIYFGFASAGMNTEKFEYSSDGEDWDLLNRVLSMHLETERIKHPGLYYHYHSKQKKRDMKAARHSGQITAVEPVFSTQNYLEEAPA